MIKIDDNDFPIVVAEKIIRGTKPNILSDGAKILYKAIGVDASTMDMFSLEEIKEIAMYLLIYYESHKSDGD